MRMRLHGSSAQYLLSLILAVFYHYTIADIYLHVPRGSNNRLSGENTNRRNANRLFDSQNNAKGGYNVPEKTQNKTTNWFHMNYYMSGPGEGQTILPIEWTNQHGCGHGDLNCNVVLQCKCQPTTITELHRAMRNGITNYSPIFIKMEYSTSTYKRKELFAKANSGSLNQPLNEHWEWYDKCATRQRNKAWEKGTLKKTSTPVATPLFTLCAAIMFSYMFKGRYQYLK